MEQLIDDCSPDSEPVLTPDELDRILDKNASGVSWKAGVFYRAGVLTQPTAANQHKYQVIQSGTSGATEPSWPTIEDGKVTDGSVIWQEDGFEHAFAYNNTQAAWDAWNMKMGRASQLVPTPGVDLSALFKNCKEMRDSFVEVLIA